MKALRAHRRGGPEVLAVEDAADPVIGDGQVLVAVHAAAITFDELTWDLSWQTTDGQDRLPVIARKPRHATWAESASLALAGLTALQALVDHAHVAAGERVLVQGGAGGVGSMAVQLAVWLGADVSATASSSDLELLRSFGAAEAFDRDSDDVGAAVPFDVVIDTVGGATLVSSFRLLGRGGRLVTLSAPPDQDEARRAGISAVFFVVESSRLQLAQLADLVDEGAIRPLLAATFPLADGRAAYASR